MPTIVIVNKTNTQQPLSSTLGILNGNGSRTFEITQDQLEQNRQILVSLARAGAITWAVVANTDPSDDSSELLSRTQIETLIEESSSGPSPIVWSTSDADAVTDNIIATFSNLTSMSTDVEAIGVVALASQNEGEGFMAAGASFSGALSGVNHRVWSSYSVVTGGENNSIGNESAANYSVISGGRNNNIYSDDCTIGGGSGNEMYSSWSCNLGGRDNFINSSASYATILGGFGNRCDGPGTQAGGIQSLAKTAGVRAFAAGQFSEAEGVPGYSFGSQQVTDAVLRGETPGIAANETVYLKAGTFFGDPTDSLVPQNDKTYFIETNVVARKTDGTSKVFINRTLASYVGSTPTFVGSNDNSQAIEIGSPNVLWDIAITEGEGTIDVAFSTGSGVTEKVRVVAHVKMTEVFSAEPI